MKVCLLTEGSYPYVVGGVSAWTQMLIEGLPDIEFSVYSIGAFAKDRGAFKYKFPQNFAGIQEVFFDEILAQQASGLQERMLSTEERQALLALVSGEGDIALLNAGFGLGGLYRGGPETYGFTFFLAAAVTLVLAWRELTHFTSDIAYYVYCAQPVFYRAPHGPLTRLARWLGNGRLVNLEQLNTEQKEGESDETDEKKRAESSAKG